MREKKYYKKRAQKILSSIHYLTLSTVSAKDYPWNTPVAYSFDPISKLFYFGSPKTTQYAKNIQNNNKGFVVIYDSKAPDGEGEGIYFTAYVKELKKDNEIDKALKIMFGVESKYKIEQFSGDSVLRAYQILPKQIWMNDAEQKKGLYIDYRVELELNDLV